MWKLPWARMGTLSATFCILNWKWLLLRQHWQPLERGSGVILFLSLIIAACAVDEEGKSCKAI
jgi:hypothetical protein